MIFWSSLPFFYDPAYVQHSENEDHGIQSHHFMANRWKISGNSGRLYFLGLQNHCRWWNFSHEIKRRLLLGGKAMINLDSILKSRGITLPTKVRLVKAMVFPVAMYGCDFSLVQFFSHVQFFATPRTTARQASLSITTPGVYSNSCPLS